MPELLPRSGVDILVPHLGTIDRLRSQKFDLQDFDRQDQGYQQERTMDFLRENDGGSPLQCDQRRAAIAQSRYREWIVFRRSAL